LLDIVTGRSGKESALWLTERGEARRGQDLFTTCDLSGAYRLALETILPKATLVADPFRD
jgi:transposase